MTSPQDLDDDPLAELERGQPYRFSDWPNPQLLPEPGVYTIWDGDQLIYAGYAGRVNTASGLRGRLDQHRKGQRSGDQFCVNLCDRLILPTLSREDIDRVAAGELKLDERVKNYVIERLDYRFKPCADERSARLLENRVLAGELSAGPPLLNSVRSRNGKGC